MDGTIADLYNVPDWLAKIHKEDVSPYLDAEPMWDMKVLNYLLLALVDEGWQIRVITWLAMDSSEEYKKEVRKAKLQWLRKHHFPTHKVHMVAYGTTKANSVRKDCSFGILIDDNEQVRNGWNLGAVIDPQETDLLEELRKLLKIMVDK